MYQRHDSAADGFVDRSHLCLAGYQAVCSLRKLDFNHGTCWCMLANDPEPVRHQAIIYVTTAKSCDVENLSTQFILLASGHCLQLSYDQRRRRSCSHLWPAEPLGEVMAQLPTPSSPNMSCKTQPTKCLLLHLLTTLSCPKRGQCRPSKSCQVVRACSATVLAAKQQGSRPDNDRQSLTPWN